jgi:hypothetical protein
MRRAPIPRRTKLTLECDLPRDFFCRGFEEFDHGGYFENARAATAAGWLERQTSIGPIFLCPKT